MDQLQRSHPALKGIRVQLRKNPPAPETHLWHRLRQEQLGVKFRRQHSFGAYVVDFYAPSIRLVIEVDGASHFDRERARARDAIRDAALAADRIAVLRFTNGEVMREMDAVCTRIAEVVAHRLCRPPALCCATHPLHNEWCATPSRSPSVGRGRAAPAPPLLGGGGILLR